MRVSQRYGFKKERKVAEMFTYLLVGRLSFRRFKNYRSLAWPSRKVGYCWVRSVSGNYSSIEPAKRGGMGSEGDGAGSNLQDGVPSMFHNGQPNQHIQHYNRPFSQGGSGSPPIGRSGAPTYGDRRASCDFCSRRKRKCDGQQPCHNCRKASPRLRPKRPVHKLADLFLEMPQKLSKLLLLETDN